MLPMGLLLLLVVEGDMHGICRGCAAMQASTCQWHGSRGCTGRKHGMTPTRPTAFCGLQDIRCYGTIVAAYLTGGTELT